ncbi:hypothetical protein B0H65DRAFT_189449 [Neurospora tetraspora]|uniref:Uncharacterized protein n=1 Tax=Neurospora tetraspora TaxID=94610 RepID=A0AAE0JEM0_9PEZI|nr:hypothetical protein B0H65DRAFT_189449 [Neurospora tetraspora]
MIHSALSNITPPNEPTELCYLVVLFLALRLVVSSVLCPIVQRPLSCHPLADKDLVSGIFSALSFQTMEEKRHPGAVFLCNSSCWSIP